MSRAELIERIRSLSDEEVERVGPYLEADLEVLADLDDLREEVASGRASAREEPLLDDEAVLERVRRRLAPRT